MNAAIAFEPLGSCKIKRWGKPQRFDFLQRLPRAPIAATELLHLSHYCPIVIMLTDEGPQIVALLSNVFTAYNVVDAAGRWRPPYAPIALRNLPFWPDPQSADIHVAPELATVAPGHFQMYDDTGNPSEEFSDVVAWMERLQSGMRRLSDAAKLLIAADLLVPLMEELPRGQQGQTPYFTICRTKISALSALQAAALSTDRCLPLDLAAACLFSQRLLAPRVAPQTRNDVEPSTHSQIAEVCDSALAIQLDKSLLFSADMITLPVHSESH